MLAPILDPFDRTAQAQRRERDEHVFGIQLATDSEPAPGMTFLQMDRLGRAREDAREVIARAVRHLGRAIELEHVGRRVITRQRAARLQRHAGVPADGKLERHHMRGLAERRVDVAIGIAQDHRLGGEPRREFAD